MAEGKRLKNQAWVFHQDLKGGYTNDVAMMALLMDIRDELQEINGQLRCAGRTIPSDLRQIAANTKKKNDKKKLRRVA